MITRENRMVAQKDTSSIRERLLDKVVGEIGNQYSQKIPDWFELQKLHFLWGNLGFMASMSYLRKIADATFFTEGPILECGSGLTTLLMGIMTKGKNIEIYSLEHHSEWQFRMEKTMTRYGLDHVTILKSPLKDFGEYDWYDVNKSLLPNGFKLVVCDGPPGNIKGSRYGLVPEMNNLLDHECTILLDDAGRKNEKEVMENWRIRHGFNYELMGGFQKFARVVRAMPTNS